MRAGQSYRAIIHEEILADQKADFPDPIETGKKSDEYQQPRSRFPKQRTQQGEEVQGRKVKGQEDTEYHAVNDRADNHKDTSLSEPSSGFLYGWNIRRLGPIRAGHGDHETHARRKEQ